MQRIGGPRNSHPSDWEPSSGLCQERSPRSLAKARGEFFCARVICTSILVGEKESRVCGAFPASQCEVFHVTRESRCVSACVGDDV